MQIKPITPQFSVSEQISADDVAQAASQGIQSIICNRPDGEAPNQPAEQSIRAAAEQAGLQFRSIAFTAGKQTADDIAAFSDALAELPGPVLAFCRTGTRSASIWAQAKAADTPVEKILADTSKAGIDLSGLRKSLEALAAQR